EAVADRHRRDWHGDDPGRVVPEPRATRGVGELPLPLGRRPESRLDPGGVVVEEVPVLEGEGEGGGRGDALPVYAEPALAAAVEPGDERAMRLGQPDEGLDDVVENRPAAHSGELFDVGEVVRAVGGGECGLHEAVVPLC